MSDLGAIFQLVKARQLPALTVRQPWASRIIARGKDIENRSRETNYRGWFMIHAGLVIDEAALRDHHQAGREWWEYDLPLGGIIGLARLAATTRDDPSPWFVGPVGYVLKNPIALPLIKCRGQQSFFKPPPEVYDQVLEALRRLPRRPIQQGKDQK